MIIAFSTCEIVATPRFQTVKAAKKYDIFDRKRMQKKRKHVIDPKTVKRCTKISKKWYPLFIVSLSFLFLA